MAVHVGGLTCEQCGATFGDVYNVEMHPRQIILLVRCMNCQHVWKVDGETPTPLFPRFGRKLDPHKP